MSGGPILWTDEYRAGGLSWRELLSGWGDGAFAMQSRQLVPGGRSEDGDVSGWSLLPQHDSESSMWPGIDVSGRLSQRARVCWRAVLSVGDIERQFRVWGGDVLSAGIGRGDCL